MRRGIHVREGRNLSPTKEPLIPNWNTLADTIDRLIVEVHKLAWFENKKREEHAKENPDSEAIFNWDNLSRDCCEYRSLLKTEINQILARIVAERKYETLKEVRTFRAPKKSVADILAEMCYNNANASLRGELAKAFEEELEG